jgi:hypothetical protein
VLDFGLPGISVACSRAYRSNLCVDAAYGR